MLAHTPNRARYSSATSDSLRLVLVEVLVEVLVALAKAAETRHPRSAYLFRSSVLNNQLKIALVKCIVLKAKNVEGPAPLLEPGLRIGGGGQI